MIGTCRVLSIVIFLALGCFAAAAAQEVAAGDPIQLAQADADEASRQVLRDFLGRDDVQHVARMAGVDMGDAMAGVMALEGDRLSDAAGQARAIDEQLGASDVITLRATTIIIILLVVLIIIIAAG